MKSKKAILLYLITGKYIQNKKTGKVYKGTRAVEELIETKSSEWRKRKILTPAEVWEGLLEGKKYGSTSTGHTYLLKDGYVVLEHNGRRSTLHNGNSECYYELSDWYLNIPKEGVKCLVGDTFSSIDCRVTITHYTEGSDYPFHSGCPWKVHSGCPWKYAIPI